MLADISAPALEKAQAKVLELVPGAKRVETKVCRSEVSMRVKWISR
jgi:hypothetical protein